MRIRRIGLSIVIAGVSTAACGGTSVSTLFDVGNGGADQINEMRDGSASFGGTFTVMIGGGGDFGGSDSGGESATGSSGAGGTVGLSDDAGSVLDSGIGRSNGGHSGNHLADAATRAPGARRVSCGSANCDVDAGEVCCATIGSTGLTVACVSSAASCSTRYACDADNDCPRGQTCCATSTALGLSGLECAVNCPSAQVPVHCTETSDCSGGVCCATLILVYPGSIEATGFTCRVSCNTTESTMCDATSPCTAGKSCQSTAAVPGGHLVCL